MKKILLLVIFTIVVFISGCETDSPNTSDKSSNTTSDKFSNKLKVLKWGPEEPLKIGTIPNKQPDGKMGVWINVSSTAGLGEMQVLFNGHPMLTAISPNGMTAGIPPEEISTAGDKKVEIQSISTKEIIPVGTLKVIP